MKALKKAAEQVKNAVDTHDTKAKRREGDEIVNSATVEVKSCEDAAVDLKLESVTTMLGHLRALLGNDSSGLVGIRGSLYNPDTVNTQIARMRSEKNIFLAKVTEFKAIVAAIKAISTKAVANNLEGLALRMGTNVTAWTSFKEKATALENFNSTVVDEALAKREEMFSSLKTQSEALRNVMDPLLGLLPDMAAIFVLAPSEERTADLTEKTSAFNALAETAKNQLTEYEVAVQKFSEALAASDKLLATSNKMVDDKLSQAKLEAEAASLFTGMSLKPTGT